MLPASYLITCLTEGVRVTTDFMNHIPTHCPHDDDHVIDPDQTRVFQYISINQTTLVDPTNGWFQSMSVCKNIPEGAVGTITTFDISWPSNIMLWSFVMYFDPTADGDVVNIVSAPDTTIGTLTEAVGIGSTTIHVSPTVTANVMVGLEITLFDGTNRNELGRVLSTDTINLLVTFETATTHSYESGSLVYLNVHSVKNYAISSIMISPCGTSMGNRITIGKNIPQNTIMRTFYTNNTGTAKKVACKLEYSIIM